MNLSVRKVGALLRKNISNNVRETGALEGVQQNELAIRESAAIA